MRNVTRFSMVAAALAVAAPASAQQRTAQPRVGIGIGVVPLEGAVTVPTIEVYVPIAMSPQLRLEPSIGIFTENQSGINAVDTTNLTLGIGVFFVRNLAPQLDMYAGGRLKLNFASVDTATFDDSGTDLFLAASLGGEYFFVPKFSLGLEGQIGRYDLSDVSGDASGFFTTGLAFLRVYF